MKIVRVYTTPATILAATSAALTNTKLSAVKMTTANSLNHGKLFAPNNTQKYIFYNPLIGHQKPSYSYVHSFHPLPVRVPGLTQAQWAAAKLSSVA
jgi:hypothetical protein